MAKEQTKKPTTIKPTKKQPAASKTTHGGKREGAGRPPGPWKFKTPSELRKKIQAYFDDCNPHYAYVGIYQEEKDADGNTIVVRGRVKYKKIQIMKTTEQKDYLVSGLCLWLKTTPETLLDYESGKYDLPYKEGAKRSLDFSDTIKHAKLAIKHYAEQKSMGPHAAGAMFNLTNNWGYKSKQEIDNKNSGEQKIIVETRKYSDAANSDN